MNLLGTELVRDLTSLIQGAEADDACHVLVFTNADPDYFISHVDGTRINEYRKQAAKLAGEASLGLLFRYMSRSRLVTLAQIEGRVRGAGSEFVLACDIRFAARESAIFSQPEQGFGLIPGAGGIQHTSSLILSLAVGRRHAHWMSHCRLRRRRMPATPARPDPHGWADPACCTARAVRSLQRLLEFDDESIV